MKIQLGEEALSYATISSHSAAAALSSLLSLAMLIAWKHLSHAIESHHAIGLIASLMSSAIILP